VPQQPTDRRPEGRPVLSGFAALVVATLGIGIVLAGGLFAGTQLLGTGGGSGDGAEAGSGAGQTLVIPDVTPEPADDEPADPPITDTPRPTLGDEEPTGDPTESTGGFTLTAPTNVAPGAQLDLSGTYGGGVDGAQLEVEQLDVNGNWGPFGVQATLRGDTYATYIFTNQVGDNTYRMTDPATGLSSDEVTVSVG